MNLEDRIVKFYKQTGLKQAEFANKVGVTQQMVSALFKNIEGEKNKEAGKKLLVGLATSFPELNTAWLLTGEGEMLISDINYRESAIYIDNPTVMYVPLVNQYAYAGYLDGFGDTEYLHELPKIPFESDREHKGDYICFEMKGDSMDDGSVDSYLEGDILLCRNVRQDYWKSKLHINKWDFVIVHKERGIVVKRIVNHDVENGKITLHSLNDYYQDYEVDLSEVAQIFNVVDFKRRKRNRG